MIDAAPLLKWEICSGWRSFVDPEADQEGTCFLVFFKCKMLQREVLKLQLYVFVKFLIGCFS